MVGQTCAVALCKSNRRTLKKQGVNLAFHSFPKSNDIVTTTIRKEWITRCKRKDKFNPNTSSICGLHFTPNDYERDLQNELLGLPLRRLLKKNAVPTMNINQSEKSQKKTTENTPCAEGAEKKNKDLVESLFTKVSSNLEPSRLLDVPSTSPAVPSNYTEISDRPSISSTPDTYKQKMNIYC